MKIKCIAIDDEPLAIDIIVNYCQRFSFLQLEKTFDNALDVIEYLKVNKTHLMFLDIHMEGLTGIQLLNILKNKPKVIMTTAYEQYALEGFELDVSDYLLKPISLERFTKAVNKVYETLLLENQKVNIQKPEINHNIPQNENYFFVRADSKLIKIKFDDILYIEGQGDYLAIVTVRGKVMTLQNFSTILHSLPSINFIRIHKSYIISFDKIEKVEKNRVYINNTPIPFSDTYKEELLQKIRKKEV